jgi:oligosaccharide repeat unit polymerase
MSTIAFLVIRYLCFYIRKENSAFVILLVLFSCSYLFQFLVGRSIEYYGLVSILNMIFIFLNLAFLVNPWKHARIKEIIVKDKTSLKFFKKFLYVVLTVNLIVNAYIMFIVLIFMPDIAEFKAAEGFLKLYEAIPYFGNVFRYAYVSQNFGYLAIPIFFYHLKNREFSKSTIAIVMASSSLLSGVAFYSRAQIFTFCVVFTVYFFLIKGALPILVKKRVYSVLRKVLVLIMSVFIVITVKRFSAMDYYGDRIPNNSVIRNPIVFSLFDYASQGFSNGYDQLAKYHESKNLHGEQLFRDFYQILNFVGILDWNVKESQLMVDTAYGFDGGAFKGYAAQMVYNCGYITTLLVSVLYSLLVSVKLKGKEIVTFLSSLELILLLFIPVVSIFYMGYQILFLPLLFLYGISLLYRFIKLLFIQKNYS